MQYIIFLLHLNIGTLSGDLRFSSFSFMFRGDFI